jgi:hypothetical protein
LKNTCLGEYVPGRAVPLWNGLVETAAEQSTSFDCVRNSTCSTGRAEA